MKFAFAGQDGRTVVGARGVFKPGTHQGAVIRGMPGMEAWAKEMKWPIDFIPTRSNGVDDFTEAILEALRTRRADCIVPMPEGLQIDGLVDRILATDYARHVTGLTKHASFIEGDKIAFHRFADKYGIPMCQHYEVVDARNASEVKQACFRMLARSGGAWMKFPLPAAGKGSRFVPNHWQFKAVYRQLMADYGQEYEKIFGKDKPWPLTIESHMAGVEISFILLVDIAGNFQILPTSMDYPERFSGPLGIYNPITGGMAGISPHPLETQQVVELFRKTIAQPLIEGIKQQGILRHCILYPQAFLFIDGLGRATEIRLSECNIRIPEPEGQAVFARIKNLGDLFEAMFNGNLHEVKPEVREDQVSMTLGLVVGKDGKHAGYPGGYSKGGVMTINAKGLKNRGVTLIPSGMGHNGVDYITDGGRVCWLQSNTPRDRATELPAKLISAYRDGLVKVDDGKGGNLLQIREDAGSHFHLAAELLS